MSSRLAQALHDAAHPDETHLRAGAIYRTMAERLTVELREHGGDLYEWLSDRARVESEVDVASEVARALAGRGFTSDSALEAVQQATRDSLDRTEAILERLGIPPLDAPDDTGERS